MAKKIWNITADLSESLCGVCPNCGGTLEQKKSYKLRCEDCGYDYSVITKNERFASWAFIGLLCAFGAGWVLALTLASMLR